MKRRAVLSAGRSQYVSPNRGLALLDEAIDQIEMHAKAAEAGGKCQWEQGEWRCASGMCLAGWVSQLAGGKWATPVSSDNDYQPYEDCLVAEAGDDSDDVMASTSAGTVIHAQERATRLLGLGHDDAYTLFEGDNTVETIKGIREELIAEGALK